ncbi:helix-turn-helix domain-containing protein [Komagataeibacter oboediens]|uniref:hypothetical protein n=1 Tax=Komagataeibacter oboediens TaxID=65958 RepID=UPI001C2DB97D|nr:hypothetical protein [Komagataeibacter oboediens]MBV1823352.1 hypothetical protein [Komagataeibacter oboediens]
MPAPLDWDAVRTELEPLLAEGLMHAEIAGRLGLTLTTVKSRVHFLGLSRPRQCRHDGQKSNHAQLNRTADAQGGAYERKPGAARKERIDRRCCNCRRAFVATSRFLFRCESCRRMAD